MRVFVTGGSGFVGSALIPKLFQQGYRVRCLLRSGSDTSRIDEFPWQRCYGDVCELESLQSGMQGCQAVIHLAAPSSWDDLESSLTPRVVVGGTENVLQAARVCGHLPVIYVSSIVTLNGSAKPQVLDEDSHPARAGNLVYANSKRQAETLCLTAARDGLRSVVINLAEVYGPNDSRFVTAGNLRDFATSSPVLVCRGGTSVVHVDDVAQGIVRALQRGRTGERYILGGENVTIRQLAALTLSELGIQRRIITVPNSIFRFVARVGTALRLPLPFNPHVVPYATRYWFVDAAKARRELDVSFRGARATIASAAAWLQQAGHLPAALQPRQTEKPAAGARVGDRPVRTVAPAA